MADPTVSVILPAASEEDWLEDAIRSIRAQTRPPLEVIVVVNGARDSTPELARRLADRAVVVEEALGYSRARNLGARCARGDFLVFLDADSRMSPDVLAEIARHARPGVFGTVLGRPFPARLKYRVFFLLKNVWHVLKLYKGALGGLLFCDAELFRAIGGFDPAKQVDEIWDFSRRARGAGGRHVVALRAFASTSMRRFERQGMFSSFWFWVRLRFPFLAGEESSAGEYV